ncbi:2977_t:CDS:2 [Diversispora eburnea]|uniref:2977_t:CDS:1 n=1 Tax=Diversispora eburnea TaxID=1213867 RepID=A0A9N8ZXL5_9GLOM|nr:2977_t:CDS:2 [Diversispora eburnea]
MPTVKEKLRALKGLFEDNDITYDVYKDMCKEICVEYVDSMPTVKEKLRALKGLFEDNDITYDVYKDMCKEICVEYVDSSEFIPIKPQRRNFWQRLWNLVSDAGKFTLQSLLSPIISAISGKLITG